MKRPLRVAAYSGLIALVFNFLLVLIPEGVITGSLFALFLVFSSALGVLFLNGFVFLGDKFKSKLLSVMSWIGIVVGVLFTVFGLVGALISAIGTARAQEIVAEDAGTIFIFLIILWIVIALIAGAYSVLFGVGLLKIKNKVAYAKTAGILEIIAGATYFILVGFLVKFAAFVFEIVLMFKASQKFEKRFC
ncbi:hypothetical protein HY450_00020 [Candidatus Pacearchaeota archaeon]|nr:hypothetical protein [Candidatus Pacearchaeota archaeon]